MSECKVNFFGKKMCKFEARYDRSSKHNIDAISAVAFDGAVDVDVPMETESVYVRDVCVNCGKTIERVK